VSGYETLASTKILNVRCAICGRLLRNPLSLEVAIGPECRERSGYDTVQVPPEAVEEANMLIRQVADLRRGPTVQEACARLFALGFTRLSAILFERFVKVVVQREENDRLTVKVGPPHAPTHSSTLAAVPGYIYDRERKLSVYPFSSKEHLWAALRELYPGEKLLNTDGRLLTIPWPKRKADGFGDVPY